MKIHSASNTVALSSCGDMGPARLALGLFVPPFWVSGDLRDQGVTVAAADIRCGSERHVDDDQANRAATHRMRGCQ